MRLNSFNMSSVVGIAQRRALSVSNVGRQPLVENLLSGIEIEAEGVSVNDIDSISAAGWSTHHDPSLRDDGMEFTLREPLYGSQLSNSIETFYRSVREGQLHLSPNPRAGTHIHVNMTDTTFGHAQAMIATMYIIDQLVFAWADEDRRWCSYCNSLNTLPAHSMRRVLSTADVGSVAFRDIVWPHGHNDRYYGFNISSLWKYGTLEFRYFPTTLEESRMWSWLDFTHGVWKYAEAFKDNDEPAVSVIDAFYNNPDAVLRAIAGDSTLVYEGLTSLADWRDSISESVEELALILSVDDVEEASPQQEQDVAESPYQMFSARELVSRPAATARLQADRGGPEWNLTSDTININDAYQSNIIAAMESIARTRRSTTGGIL